MEDRIYTICMVQGSIPFGGKIFAQRKTECTRNEFDEVKRFAWNDLLEAWLQMGVKSRRPCSLRLFLSTKPLFRNLKFQLGEGLRFQPVWFISPQLSLFLVRFSR
ncbi:hypothetical protein Y032_0016g3067 [Ancylostoma ceylanicum]|uniref:Uncharacterized protein n=1 Tax=Ancylostoma ceylanicum TaxID=53326 RepID=A0A016V7M1_9BILA|nr:hypothetical protein Y032_0016g3067 [Ancylostoma ceylanicum]